MSRADVVALLMDLRPDPDLMPDEWCHDDGRPLSDEERTLVGAATWDDLMAARALLALDVEMGRDGDDAA